MSSNPSEGMAEGHQYLFDEPGPPNLRRPKVRFSHLALPGEDSTLCGLPRTHLLHVAEAKATISCLRCEKKRVNATAD